VWCLIGAPPRGQPWTPVVTLPHGRDGLSARWMAVLCAFREPSMGRHVHRELLRNALLDVTPIIPLTACHQRNYVETYSRYKTLESNLSVVGSAEDPGDSGEVGCRGGATVSCRFPIPHSVLLGSTASVHALQHSLVLSLPADTSASSTLPQATAAAVPVKFAAGRATGGHRHTVFAVLQGPASFHLTCSRRCSACLPPCLRVQEGDRHVSCRPRPTPHGSIAERPTPHAPRSASCTILASTLVIILSSSKDSP
jgi:hypothetical protein